MTMEKQLKTGKPPVAEGLKLDVLDLFSISLHKNATHGSLNNALAPYLETQ